MTGGHGLNMRIANNTARLRRGQQETKKQSICLEVIHNRPIKERREEIFLDFAVGVEGNVLASVSKWPIKQIHAVSIGGFHPLVKAKNTTEMLRLQCTPPPTPHPRGVRSAWM